MIPRANFDRVALLLKNSPAGLLAVARSKINGTSPKDWFSGFSDDTWFWANTQGRRRLKPLAAIVPGVPDEATQALYTGSSEDTSLGEGFKAYQIFKGYYEKHVGELSASRGILDFGCGWGRIIRFFLRDVAPEQLSGVDHAKQAIRICQETNRWLNFQLIEPQPPTPLGAGAFDLIYLYSVFSHLPEALHLDLLQEFDRLLTPGGLLIATTRSRDFIETCASWRTDPDMERKPWINRQTAQRFADVEASLTAFDNGQYCYDGYGSEGRWAFWGEACIPRAYVERRWSEIFEVLDFNDDRRLCPQNVIVARKPLTQYGDKRLTMPDEKHRVTDGRL